jgi:hypothetical protein
MSHTNEGEFIFFSSLIGVSVGGGGDGLRALQDNSSLFDQQTLAMKFKAGLMAPSTSRYKHPPTPQSRLASSASKRLE